MTDVIHLQKNWATFASAWLRYSKWEDGVHNMVMLCAMFQLKLQADGSPIWMLFRSVCLDPWILSPPTLRASPPQETPNFDICKKIKHMFLTAVWKSFKEYRICCLDKYKSKKGCLTLQKSWVSSAKGCCFKEVIFFIFVWFFFSFLHHLLKQECNAISIYIHIFLLN